MRKERDDRPCRPSSSEGGTLLDSRVIWKRVVAAEIQNAGSGVEICKGENMKIESPEVLEQERPLTLEEKAKLFPLSFWMRLGAKMKPQGQVHLIHEGKTCAIGAALDALCAPIDYDSAHRLFPCLEKKIFGHRLIAGEKSNLMWEILERNDPRKRNGIIVCMTREQIADWLESIGY
jgi:hypothetical protein